MKDISEIVKKMNRLTVDNPAIRAMEKLNVNSAAQLAQDMARANTVAQRSIDMMRASSAVQIAQDMARVNSVAQRAMDMMRTNSAVQIAQDMARVNSVAQSAMDMMQQNNTFFRSMGYLAESNQLAASINPLFLQTIDDESFIDLEDEEIAPQIIEEIERVSSSSDLDTFKDNFNRLHPAAKLVFYVMYFVFAFLVVPQFNNLIVTPYIEECLENDSAAKREKVNSIKKIGLYENVETSGLKFVTGDNVRLRAKPSTNSSILDELQLGQVVTVLSKKKNWIEVQYTYGDNEILSGWVFTRYTSRFKK